MISNFKENNPHGLSIFMAPEKGESLTIMDSNKTVKTIIDPKEIENTKASSEYEELRQFYDNIPQLIQGMKHKN